MRLICQKYNYFLKVEQMADIIPQSFYEDKDVVSLAKLLLGKLVTTFVDGEITSGIIVETEAYRAPDDKGCHAYGDKKTERTKTMFLKGGVAYIYLCYGMHGMLNVVTGPEGYAHAVLIRAIAPVEGQPIMCQRRKMYSKTYELTNGPGKFAQALGITKILDGTTLFNHENVIFISDIQKNIDENDIISGPRVGMTHHVGSCAHRPWRFYIKNNPWVSKPLRVDYTGKW